MSRNSSSPDQRRIACLPRGDRNSFIPLSSFHAQGENFLRIRRVGRCGLTRKNVLPPKKSCGSRRHAGSRVAEGFCLELLENRQWEILLSPIPLPRPGQLPSFLSSSFRQFHPSPPISALFFPSRCRKPHPATEISFAFNFSRGIRDKCQSRPLPPFPSFTVSHFLYAFPPVYSSRFSSPSCSQFAFGAYSEALFPLPGDRLATPLSIAAELKEDREDGCFRFDARATMIPNERAGKLIRQNFQNSPGKLKHKKMKYCHGRRFHSTICKINFLKESVFERVNIRNLLIRLRIFTRL